MPRFQIDLTDDEAAMIDAIAQLTGARLKREVVMEAIVVYRWAVRQVAQGCDVVAISGDHRTTIETPGLSVAREKGEKGRAVSAERLGLTE